MQSIWFTISILYLSLCTARIESCCQRIGRVEVSKGVRRERRIVCEICLCFWGYYLSLDFSVLHSKDIVPKIRNKHSQKWNCAALFPIPKFMYLRAIYMFQWSVCLFFCCCKIGKPIVEIYKSLRDTWMWKLRTMPRVSFLGIHKLDRLCSVLGCVPRSTRRSK